MKTLFGIAAVLAVAAVSMATVDSAEARGNRGGGPRAMSGGSNVSINQVRVGPRVTAPVVRPERIGTQQFPQRQINGPRESGRGVNCHRVRQPGGQPRPWREPPRIQCPQRI
jgi:hypothetical protein